MKVLGTTVVSPQGVSTLTGDSSSNLDKKAQSKHRVKGKALCHLDWCPGRSPYSPQIRRTSHWILRKRRVHRAE